MTKTKLHLLALCGMIAPFVLAFTAILGGVLRPGYSHMSETISELFTPGAPNKLLLDTLHSSYAVLMILFGIGVLLFVRDSEHPSSGGITAAFLLIAMGVASFLIAAVFSQDPWGTPFTFAGSMHISLSGVISVLTLVAMLLLAYWSRESSLPPWFWMYTMITLILTILAASLFLINVNTPFMGLTERISVVMGFQWVFTLGLLIFKRE